MARRCHGISSVFYHLLMTSIRRCLQSVAIQSTLTVDISPFIKEHFSDRISVQAETLIPKLVQSLDLR